MGKEGVRATRRRRGCEQTCLASTLGSMDTGTGRGGTLGGRGRTLALRAWGEPARQPAFLPGARLCQHPPWEPGLQVSAAHPACGPPRAACGSRSSLIFPGPDHVLSMEAHSPPTLRGDLPLPLRPEPRGGRSRAGLGPPGPEGGGGGSGKTEAEGARGLCQAQGAAPCSAACALDRQVPLCPFERLIVRFGSQSPT